MPLFQPFERVRLGVILLRDRKAVMVFKGQKGCSWFKGSEKA